MARPEEKKGGRPTNEDLYNKDPEIEPGTEQAVAAAQAAYPTGKVLESKSIKGESEVVTGYEVTVGYQDEQSAYHIVELEMDAQCTITSTEERPDQPPGQANKPPKG